MSTTIKKVIVEMVINGKDYSTEVDFTSINLDCCGSEDIVSDVLKLT